MKHKRRLYLLPHERYLMRFIETRRVGTQPRQGDGPYAAAINAAYTVDGISALILSSAGLIVTVIAIALRDKTVGYAAIVVWCIGIALGLLAMARTIQGYIVWRSYRKEVDSQHEAR